MKIILSCTTTSNRSDLFYYTALSLMNQSMKPDIFILNISQESYLKDDGFSKIPDWMNNGIMNINWVENTGPYRKLLPSIIHAEDDDLIVTSDDDVLYGKMWLEEIVNAAIDDPEAIICSRARRMKKNSIGKWMNYSNWHLENKKTRDALLLPIGCAGIAYNKRNLDLNFLLDRKYLEIAPTTDDLWFKMASLRKNVQVSVFPGIDNHNTYMIDSCNSLYDINSGKTKSNSLLVKLIEKLFMLTAGYLGVNQSTNDSSWDKICEYSKLTGWK